MHSGGSPLVIELSHNGFGCCEKHNFPKVEVAGPKLEQNSKCKESLLKTVKIALTNLIIHFMRL